MLAMNERIYPPYMRSNKVRAYRHALLIAFLPLALCVAAAVPALAQVSGQNVNMVSGTNWTNGDPFLQRQNEPSIAVSSRNSSHLLAGANDYRTVDLPGLLGIDERGDAWLGLFKSFDGGRTWQSTLLPGFPLDGSPQGQASPIHGFKAASDPVVRAGTNGLFYYTGLAFNRGSNPPSTIFVSRFIDLNNKENGDATFESGSMTNLQPRDTIKYVDTTIVDHATPETFLDKPWVAVDIPRQGATCTFSVNEDGQTVTQTIPAGQVYLTYTKFVGSGQSQVSTIVFKKSHDCGATWSSPRILSQNDESSGDAEHQGTVIAIDPSVPPSEPATVYVAWRRFASINDLDDPPAIFLAKSVDGGVQWGTPFPVVVFPKSCIPTIQNPNPTGVGCPFDQVFTNASFRSNGYPALTVDSTGRVYVAWSQRDANGDGKIMMGIAPGGRSIQSASIAPVDIGAVADDDGNAFSNLSGRGSQLMPSLSFEAGKLVLAYYDLRQDHTTGTFVEAPNPNCDPVVTLPCALGAQYLESRTLEGEIGPPNPSNDSSVFSPYVADSAPPLTVRRHTIDVMGAEAVPPPSSSLQPPSFKAFRITNYLFGSIPQLFQDVEQIQFNAPNLPLFVDGTKPFMGDYIDVSGTPQIIPDGKGGWTFNTNPSANPVFHASWTDNRDVVPPADGNWQNYTPPISASNPGSQPSKFDPTQQPLACVVGQTGMRNQNVYTAEISQGVILTSPQTSKPVLTPGGQPIQRAFVVEVRNATNAARSFQVSIPSQPATAKASFQQFGSLTTQTVKVNAFSSQSLPVFVVANAGSTFAFPSVLVTATENDGANPPLTGSVLLNPDPTNPALTSPDNAAIGGSQISINEFYNPGVANPGVANSGVASPGVANPGVANPGVANPGVANPTVVLALNPGVANPGVANPGVANPGVANPGVANESVTDASYTFTNEGNTSAAYTIQFFQSAPFPAGAKFQIILSKVYFTEQAVGCQIQQVGSNVIVANVTNPVFVTDPTQLGNPGVANLGVQTPTINLAPSESGQVTIRTNLSVAQVESQVLPNVSPVAVSRAVNTVDVQKGIFTPPINLIITSTSGALPLGVVTQPYNTSLTSVGGNTGPRNWTITSGSLPPGLQLNAASGAITGTPTQAGSFPFTAQVTDTGAPQHTATRDLTITVVPPVLVTTPSPALVSGVVGSVYTQTFSAAGGRPPYTWSSTGTLPTGLALSSSGTLSGVPTTPGTYSFTVKATDSVGLFATAPYTILVTNVPVQPARIAFVVQPSNAVGSKAISPAVQVQVFDAAGAVIPGSQVSMNFGNPACSTATLSGSPLATTNASGIATFSDLIIDRGQNNYTLAATAGNATAVSNPFTVNGFCATGNLSIARGSSNSSTLLPSGKVLIAGGAISSGAGIITAELYDPSTGLFTPTGSMGTARSFHTATLLPTGKVLIAGGQGSASASTTAELYDPATGVFTSISNMNASHDAHTATLLTNGKVLIAGGFNQTAELYDPTTGVFTVTGSTTSIRVENTGTLLANGKVLLTGGGDANGPLATAEIYDPGLGTFTATGSMSVPREAHAATLLPNGKVLVSGGLTAFNPTVVTASADLFDPANGTFVPTGSLNSPQAFQAQTVLADGEVLMTAGVNAELYDSTTALFSATGGTSGSHAQTPSTLLNNGTVLVAGGNAGSVQAELYYSTTPSAPLAITTTSLFNASTGQPYTQILLEQGGLGTLSWKVTGTLPAGMTFSNQGLLSGTPTVAGSFPLTFTVTDSSNPAKSASSNFTLAVANTPLVFTSTTMPTALTGKPYTQTLPVAGGTQPYNGTVTNGTPPPGLTLVGNVLTGTPSGTGTFTFTVTVTDSSTPTQTATQTLTIAANTLVITTTALPSGIVGVPYNATISTAGGTPPLSFSLATAAFPPGLSIQQGALAGTPTQAGNFFFSETVVDSSTPAQTATQNYEVTIAPSGTPAPANVTFVSQPQNSTGGQILTGSPIRVHVTDANNAPITGTSVAISFNGAPPCSSAVLSGTLNGITNGAGNAVFPDLSIDRGQLGYTLLASTGSASAISNAFNVEGFCGTGSLATARALLNSVTLLNGKVLIAGGAPAFSNQAVAFSSAELYDPVARSFTPVGSMHSGRSSISIALLQNGLVLVAGGFNGSANLSSAELFDPATNTFTLLPGSMITARGGGTATLLANGKVLITGGTGNAGVLASAEIFDPATNTFTATSQPMSSPRAIHEAILLPNGKVLITGGFTAFSATGPSNPLASAELYDPVTDTFTLTGSMAMARYEHASALLFTGKVLVFGGFTANNFSVPLATAEIYDPSAGTFSSTATATQASAGYLGPVPVLPDGTVFLYGGGNAQIYDPALGTFRVTGNTTTIQAQPVTSLLSDGTVLVTGGVGSPTFNTGLANAEIFYPSFTPGITITLTLLPNATQNQPYSQVLLEQGGVGALTWTLVANSSLLPPGLTLSSSGIISGTPTQFGAFPITVQVTDSSVPPKSATITYGLIVLPQLQFLGNQLVTAFSGTPYNNSLLLVGGTAPYTITLAAGTLPAGLVFTPASSTFPTGQINGTTTAVGNYTLTFQATDSSVPPQSTTAALTLGVTTPLTITNSTLPNGSLGASYSATVSTTGGLGTLVFGVASGSLPPGVTMGFQGVLSGIPASTGTFSFTVLGFDQSFPFQIATQSYTLTITTAVAPIVLSPDPLNLLANSSGTMSVTLNAAAGASGQVVTLSSSNSSVASVPASVTVLPQATTATFQVTAGTSTNNATITASAAGFTSGNGSVVVVGCPSTVNLTLCGRYSMGVVGFSSSGGPVAGGVTFVADNSGHIVSGTGKFNQSVAGPTTSTITGGSYVMDSSGDGRGVLTLIDSTASSRTYRFVLESLANAGVAQVEEFDNSGTLASGIIAGPEAPPVPQIPANTTVALNVEGINGSGQLAALLGEFQVGSSGCDGTVGSFNSLAGEPIVTNTAGTVNTALTATGSCTASDPNTGLGTAQITISGGTPFTNSTLKFVYIAVGSGTTLQGVFFLEVDPIAANQPILSGLAEGVTVPAGGFNASSPACPCLLVRSGTTDGTSTTGHSVGSIVRILTTPGIGASGTLTGVLDQNAGGTITLAGAWPYTSYTVDSNGVGTITGTGSPVHFIITGSGSDFTMQTLDESVSVLTGSFRAQNATTIQAAGAPYIVGLGNGDFVGANRNVESAVGVITPSGATSGTLTGTVDVISSAGPVVGATASGTYAIDSTTGRGTGIANLTGGTSSVPIVIYARRVRQFVVLDVQSSDPYQFGARLQ